MSLNYFLTNLYSKYTIVSADILFYNNLMISKIRSYTMSVFVKTYTVIKDTSYN